MCLIGFHRIIPSLSFTFFLEAQSCDRSPYSRGTPLRLDRRTSPVFSKTTRQLREQKKKSFFHTLTCDQPKKKETSYDRTISRTLTEEAILSLLDSLNHRGLSQQTTPGAEQRSSEDRRRTRRRSKAGAAHKCRCHFPPSVNLRRGWAGDRELDESPHIDLPMDGNTTARPQDGVWLTHFYIILYNIAITVEILVISARESPARQLP